MISAEQIEEHTGVLRTDEMYKLAVIQVCKLIQPEFTVIRKGDGIVICTDEEAVDVNCRRLKAARACLGVPDQET